MLTVTDMTTGYGRTPVVHGVTINVAAGQVTAVLGANGAGKTALLLGITGLNRHTGSVTLDGRDVTRLAAYARSRAGIAIVPEGRQVFRDLSVYENLVCSSRSPRARAIRKERLALVYELFPRLAERRTQPAHLMSGGEQQMIAIGRALMADPKVLVLDEPSLGLAPVVVSTVFAALDQLKALSVTTLLVEQNVSHALGICEYAYVIEKGRVVIEGTGKQIADDPRIAAAYLGL